MKSTVEEFDLFSKPFVFFVGKKKSKSTFFGGIISLSVLAVSGAYFYYLIHMYFSNKVEPKITQSNLIETTYTSLLIKDSFFIFQYFISGVPLTLYQEQVNKTFLTFSVYYDIFYTNGTFDRFPITLQYCTDELFLGYLCLNQAEVINRNIFMDITQNISSDFALEINYCDPTIYDNCASPTELYNTIFRRQNVFSINIQVKQYIATSRKYESGYKQEYYYLDPNNVVSTRFSLIKASTTVVEGMIIQYSEQNDTIYDYKRIDTVFSNIDIQTRLDFSGIAYLVFENNQVKNIITVQHAMITETLAQFMSIFNSLLTVGILCRMLAETQIVEDLNSILLKEYYKKTALRLVSRYDNRQTQARNGSPSMKGSENKKESQNIGILQKKIKEIDFSEQSRKYFELSSLSQLKMFFSKLLGKHRDVEKSQISKQTDEGDAVIYQHLLNQSVKRINIFEVYKDLIKLKMAIKLILTKEQFAAIQFCGSELIIEEKENGNDNRKEKEKMSTSHNENMKKEQQEGEKFVGTLIAQKAEFPIQTAKILGQQKYQENEAILSNNIPLSPVQSFNQSLDFPKLFSKEGSQESTEQKKQKYNEKDEVNEFNMEILIGSSKIKSPITQLVQSEQVNENQVLHQQSIIELIKSESPKKEKTIKLNSNNMQLIHGDQNDSDLLSFHDSEISSQKTEKIRKNELKKIDIKKVIRLAKKNRKRNEKNGENNSKITKESVYQDKNRQGQCQSVNRSHLYEMDLIEENQELQEQLLQQFLDRVSSGNERRIKDHIDRQIFGSLIKQEKQMSIFDCYTKMTKKRQVEVDMKQIVEQSGRSNYQEEHDKVMQIKRKQK